MLYYYVMNRPEKITAPRMERLYITKDKQEWVDIDQALLEKMRLLRKMQPDPSQVHNDIHGYFNSADNIQGANCHKTALYLTGKITEEELFAHTNHDLETAGHVFVASSENTEMLPKETTVEGVIKKLKQCTLPVRVTFFAKYGDKILSKHSITIIGVTNKGQFKGFEKEDTYAEDPFQDVDVRTIVSEFLNTGHMVGIEKQ